MAERAGAIEEGTGAMVQEGLNAAQQAAVAHGDGPLLVIAGAGTGKTTVITHRIAHLINTKRARPEQILAMTFTEKAAAEMERRVDLLVPYGFTDTWISTFHAFGDRVLRENALVLGLSPDFRLLTQAEQVIFLQEHLFELPLDYFRPLGNPMKHVQALLQLFSRAKDEDVGPQAYAALAEQLEKQAIAAPDDEVLAERAKRESEIAQAYQRYQELMAREGKLDFGDLMTQTLTLLREHPLVLRQMQERFRYILVDEFQDTNYAQFEIVKLLAATHRNVTVVGDDDQSIFKFRGASISNILNFRKEWPQNADGSAIESLVFQIYHEEADWAAGKIQEFVEAKEYAPGSIAILVRRNSDADPFLRALNMKGIPWRFSGARGLYDREEIRLVVSFLRLLADPHDSLSLFHLAGSDIYGMPAADLVLCNGYASRKRRSLYEVLTEITRRPGSIPELSGVSSEGIATASAILDDLDRYLGKAAREATGRILYDFLMERPGYCKRLVRSNSPRDHQRVGNLAEFFGVVQRFGEVAPQDRVAGFVPYLTMLIEAGEDPPIAEGEEAAEAVQVLTLHKAKGLEFEAVFLVGLVEKRFPSVGRREAIALPEELIKDLLPSGDFHLQEERRLFYVGLTRAKRHLFLTRARDYGTKREWKRSRFLAEALELPKEEEDHPWRGAPEAVIGRAAPPPDIEPDLCVSADTPLNLSHYKIDDYLTCPLKYKYVHILRVPVLRDQAVVYGAALHRAVQAYHNRRVQGVPMSLQELIDSFEDHWVNEGFISREHEERRLQEGRDALAQFYAFAEAAPPPTSVEKKFRFQLGHDIVTGYLDRLDERAGETVIIDYKTSSVRDQKDADKDARESQQLALYALAYREAIGRLPDRVELHFLTPGGVVVGRAFKGEKELERVADRIRTAAGGIRTGLFQATPNPWVCGFCAFRTICPATAWTGEREG
ncbi:MAG: UvrD-helicase domain-containing protein [candidate division NC10 bacterium]|nr:UvrD-helicase domain-containing protein [candidate division NC10 bacterium]